jgi:hypothetical protein
MSQQEAQFHTVRFLLNKTVFDDNVINIILYYYWDTISDKKLVMLDWINTTLLHMRNVRNASYFLQNNYYESWYNVSKNPNAISYIEENIDMVCWNGLVKNPNAMHLLNEHTVQIAYADCWEHIFSNIHGIDFFFNNTNKLIEYNYDPSWNTDDYDELINTIIEEGMVAICKNPNVISLISKDDPNILHIGQLVDWSSLSSNPDAIHLLEANKDKINWSNLSKNPNAIHLLEANKHRIDWANLSKNPNAIHLLEANQDKINWANLSKNPNAIHLLEANQDKIDWSTLSKNPNAIDLLEANKDKIDWSSVYRNPSIFHRRPMPNY